MDSKSFPLFFWGWKLNKICEGKKDNLLFTTTTRVGKKKTSYLPTVISVQQTPKKILSVVYDWNKDEPKTWQTLWTKDTNQERGSGGQTKVAKHKTCELAT